MSPEHDTRPQQRVSQRYPPPTTRNLGYDLGRYEADHDLLVVQRSVEEDGVKDVIAESFDRRFKSGWIFTSFQKGMHDSTNQAIEPSCVADISL